MKIRWLGLFWIVSCSVGCTNFVHHQEAEPRDPRATKEPHRLVLDAPLDLEKACAGWQWVGIKIQRDEACPIPDGSSDWTVSHVFRPEGEAAGSQVKPTQIPPGLRSFCLYHRAGEGDESVLEALVTDKRLARLDKDCAAVAPAAAGDLLDLTGPTLQERFYRHAGGTYLPTSQLKESKKARLVVVDTQPTGVGVPTATGTSRHGYTLAHMIRQLLCNRSDADCVAEFRTRLALPLRTFDPDDSEGTERDPDNGGYFGSLVDLAQAIRFEIADWQDSSDRKQLILNLSIGWDGARFRERYEQDLKSDMCSVLGNGETNEDPKVGISTLAVFCAMQDSACRGALTIAAAGNRTGGPAPTTGPLYPAAWEVHGVPSGKVCNALTLNEAPSVGYESTGEPMVYAVGGVTATEEPIVNSRAESLPGLVAYADHAVASDLAGKSTRVLTGTSVAAAVVSATAAAVRNCQRGIDRQLLMQWIRESGSEIDHPRSFPESSALKFGGLDAEVQWISLCRAVESLCTVEGCGGREGCVPDESYQVTVECGEWPPAESDTQALRAQLDKFQPDRSEDGSTIVDSLGGFNPICSANEILYDKASGVPGVLCPFEQFHSLRAHSWTTPQPEEDPCATCSLKEEDGNPLLKGPKYFTLWVEIDPLWAGRNLRSPVLYLGANAHHLKDHLDLKLSSTQRVPNLSCDKDPCFPARLTFQSDKGSVQSPLLVF